MFKALLLLLSPALLLAQLSWNALTVTASRGQDFSDGVVFLVSVESAPDAALDEVVAALQPVGITAADLAGLTPLSLQLKSVWQFRLTAPLARLKDTTAALGGIQRTLAGNGKMALSFSIQGVRALERPPETCDWTNLLAAARLQAKDTATAAGLNAGNILALTGSPSPCHLTVRFALGLMYGQAEPYTITAQVNRSVALQPDQVAIGLEVSSAPDAGVDDIAAALREAGVTGATFSDVGTWQFSGPGAAPQTVLRWSFKLAVPFSRLKDTLTLLAAAQQAMARKGSLPAFTFSVGGSEPSQDAFQRQTCLRADLMTEARAHAQKMAAAAAVAVGPILSISDYVSTAGSAAGGPLSSVLTNPPSCTLAVQFQLLRN